MAHRGHAALLLHRGRAGVHHRVRAVPEERVRQGLRLRRAGEAAGEVLPRAGRGGRATSRHLRAGARRGGEPGIRRSSQHDRQELRRREDRQLGAAGAGGGVQQG